MRDVLYVIAESLAVAGPILYSGAESAARSAHGTSVQVVA